MTTPVQPETPRTEKPYTVKRIFRHIFTGKDNATIDINRVMWGVGGVAFIVITGYIVWKTGTWNPLEWSSAFAVLNGGGAGASKIKESTEPAE